MTVACVVLLDESASAAVGAAETVALATALPAVLAVAAIEKGCDAPTASPPSVQFTVPLELAQPAGSEVARLTPLPTEKARVAALLASGPAFVT